MPLNKKKERSLAREAFQTLLTDTDNFLTLYKIQHDKNAAKSSYLSPSRILPYDQKRINAAQLIESVSQNITENISKIGDYDSQYAGPIHKESRKALASNALKGSLLLALLQVDNEYAQYNQTYTACLFKATPVKETALYSLALETLHLPQFDMNTMHDEITTCLKALQEYLNLMIKAGQWEDTPYTQKALQDIKEFLTPQAAEHAVDAANAAAPAVSM